MNMKPEMWYSIYIFFLNDLPLSKKLQFVFNFEKKQQFLLDDLFVSFIDLKNLVIR